MIKRSDIDLLFQKPQNSESLQESTLRSLVIKHDIPKFRHGIDIYMPKILLKNY